MQASTVRMHPRGHLATVVAMLQGTGLALVLRGGGRVATSDTGDAPVYTQLRTGQPEDAVDGAVLTHSRRASVTPTQGSGSHVHWAESL